MKVWYVGDYDEVWVPEARASCKQGESLEVDEELGKRLCEQQANWAESKKGGKQW